MQDGRVCRESSSRNFQRNEKALFISALFVHYKEKQKIFYFTYKCKFFIPITQ